jgi:RND family efflux transporter MFP subunit
VVEVVPNVSGEVVEIPVEGLEGLKQGDVLFQIDPRPFEYALDGAKAKLEEAQANRKLADLELQRNLQAARTNAVAARDVDVWRARLAAADAAIQSAHSQIDTATYDVEESTVRAPSDGYVVGLTLRPGQRVTSMPLRSWMAFVDASRTYVVAGIQQYALRHVKPGQVAEVIFKVHPGQTFPGKVVSVVGFGTQGQLVPSGEIPAAPSATASPQPFGVRLELDGGAELLKTIPPGSVGTAAIYTESASVTHVIRQVMLRMQTFLNYVMPS